MPLRTDWWNEANFAHFTGHVLKHPGDDTNRLVLADWLDEQDTPTARARAKIIRAQIADHYAVAFLRPADYARHGFPEEAYQATAGMMVRDGWPAWVVFLPTMFAYRTVRPVMQLTPATTVSVVRMCAEVSAERGFPFRVQVGPEDASGEVHPDELGHAGRRDLIRAARRGINYHRELYAEPGVLPAPIHHNLPPRPGAGGSAQWPDDRHDRFRNLDDAAARCLKAAWRVARLWAHQSYGAPPAPEPAAVFDFRQETLRRRLALQHGHAITAPSEADDPFATWREMDEINAGILDGIGFPSPV